MLEFAAVTAAAALAESAAPSAAEAAEPSAENLTEDTTKLSLTAVGATSIQTLNERVTALSATLDLHSLQMCLSILLSIDEQLFAMTLHSDASRELRSAFSSD